MTPRPQLKILIVIGQLGRGGAERQIHELVTRMDPKRFLPIVVTFTPDGYYQRLIQEAGVEVIVLQKKGLKELTVISRLASIMKQRQIDVVHAWLFPASWRSVLAARLAGVKRVACAVRSTGLWMNGRHKFMDRSSLRSASVVIANAPAVRDDIIRRTGVPAGRVKVIMNGVDTGAFHPGGADWPPGWPGPQRGKGGVRVAGFIGSLRKAKDPGLFIKIAGDVGRRLGPARFVIVGGGPLRGHLEEMPERRELDGRLAFAGERSDIPAVLRALDLLVVTSEREGCCNVILEAMATGIPVAATAVGGNPDLVSSGRNGILFPYGDVAAGADAVLRLLSDESLAAGMGRAALADARAGFSVDAMVRATSDLYEEIAR